MAAFSTSANKGFALTFSNGNIVSVQWGPMNYCEKKYERFDAPMETPLWSSETAEVAASNSAHEDHVFPNGDTVNGWLTPEEVAKFIEFVATNELNTQGGEGS